MQIHLFKTGATHKPKQPMKDEKKKLTTASGRPYYENENSMTLGPDALFCRRM